MDTESRSSGISSALFGVVAILFFLAAIFQPMSSDALSGICWYLGCGFVSLGLAMNTPKLYERVVFSKLFEAVPMRTVPAACYVLSSVCFAVGAFLFALKITR